MENGRDKRIWKRKKRLMKSKRDGDRQWYWYVCMHVLYGEN